MNIDLNNASAAPFIQRIQSGEYEYQASLNRDVTVLFNDINSTYTHLVAVKKEDKLLRFALRDAEPFEAEVLGTSTMLYSDTFTDTDIYYDLSDSELKESIMLNSSLAPKTFVFDLEEQGVTAVLREDNSIDYMDENGNLIWTIQAPYAFDADGSVVPVSLVFGDGIYSLTVEPSADAVYPIILDPTVYTGISSTSTASQRKVAKDSTGNWYAVFNNNATPSQIKCYKSTNLSTWTDMGFPEISGYVQSPPAIAVDNDDNMHIIWYGFDSVNTDKKQIKHSMYNGSSWSSWQNIAVVSGHAQFGPSITVDSSNNLHVVWCGYDSANAAAYQIKYSKSADSGASWSAWTNVASITGKNQYYPSIAVDGSNNIHVTWHGTDSTNTSNNQVKYSKSTDGGTTWSSWANVAVVSSYAQDYPVIATDSLNRPHVFWRGKDTNSGGCYRVKHSYHNGSSWTAFENVSTITSIDMNQPSVCIAPNDDIHLASYVSGAIKYAVHDGTSWSSWSNIISSSYLYWPGLPEKFAYSMPLIYTNNSNMDYYVIQTAMENIADNIVIDLKRALSLPADIDMDAQRISAADDDLTADTRRTAHTSAATLHDLLRNVASGWQEAVSLAADLLRSMANADGSSYDTSRRTSAQADTSMDTYRSSGASGAAQADTRRTAMASLTAAGDLERTLVSDDAVLADSERRTSLPAAIVIDTGRKAGTSADRSLDTRRSHYLDVLVREETANTWASKDSCVISNGSGGLTLGMAPFIGNYVMSTSRPWTYSNPAGGGTATMSKTLTSTASGSVLTVDWKKSTGTVYEGDTLNIYVNGVKKYTKTNMSGAAAVFTHTMAQNTETTVLLEYICGPANTGINQRVTLNSFKVVGFSGMVQAEAGEMVSAPIDVSEFPNFSEIRIQEDTSTGVSVWFSPNGISYNQMLPYKTYALRTDINNASQIWMKIRISGTDYNPPVLNSVKFYRKDTGTIFARVLADTRRAFRNLYEAIADTLRTAHVAEEPGMDTRRSVSSPFDICLSDTRRRLAESDTATSDTRRGIAKSASAESDMVRQTVTDTTASQDVLRGISRQYEVQNDAMRLTGASAAAEHDSLRTIHAGTTSQSDTKRRTMKDVTAASETSRKTSIIHGIISDTVRRIVDMTELIIHGDTQRRITKASETVQETCRRVTTPSEVQNDLTRSVGASAAITNDTRRTVYGESALNTDTSRRTTMDTQAASDISRMTSQDTSIESDMVRKISASDITAGDTRRGTSVIDTSVMDTARSRHRLVERLVDTIRRTAADHMVRSDTKRNRAVSARIASDAVRGIVKAAATKYDTMRAVLSRRRITALNLVNWINKSAAGADLYADKTISLAAYMTSGDTPLYISYTVNTTDDSDNWLYVIFQDSSGSEISPIRYLGLNIDGTRISAIPAGTVQIRFYACLPASGTDLRSIAVNLNNLTFEVPVTYPGLAFVDTLRKAAAKVLSHADSRRPVHKADSIGQDTSRKAVSSQTLHGDSKRIVHHTSEYMMDTRRTVHANGSFLADTMRNVLDKVRYTISSDTYRKVTYEQPLDIDLLRTAIKTDTAAMEVQRDITEVEGTGIVTIGVSLMADEYGVIRIEKGI